MAVLGFLVLHLLIRVLYEHQPRVLWELGSLALGLPFWVFCEHQPRALWGSGDRRGLELSFVLVPVAAVVV